jgi:hypothetical protein
MKRRDWDRNGATGAKRDGTRSLHRLFMFTA